MEVKLPSMLLSFGTRPYKGWVCGSTRSCPWQNPGYRKGIQSKAGLIMDWDGDSVNVSELAILFKTLKHLKRI